MNTQVRDLAPRTYQGENFRNLTGEPGDRIENLSLVDCTFDSFRLSLAEDPTMRTLVSKVTLERCKVVSGLIGPAQVVDVRVHDLATADLVIVLGALFERVTLSGKLGQIKISPDIFSRSAFAPTQGAFDATREAHYAAVDWALDITDARPSLLEIDGIPGSKVRINPETQCVVSRQKLIDAEFDIESLGRAPGGILMPLEAMLAEPVTNEDVVLVAPTGQAKSRYKLYLDAFARLRELGVTSA